MDELFRLVKFLYAEAPKHRSGIKAMIKKLHRHTYMVELGTRLLNIGRITVEELLDRLDSEHRIPTFSDKFHTYKNNHCRDGTYREQIRVLYKQFPLSQLQSEILQHMLYGNLSGMSKEFLRNWIGLPDYNEINDLVDMGLIYSGKDKKVVFHSVIYDLVYDDREQTYQNCLPMLEHTRSLCLVHGLEYPWYGELLCAIQNILDNLECIDPDYLDYLMDYYSYVDKYNDRSLLNGIVDKLRAAVNDDVSMPCDTKALVLFTVSMHTYLSAYYDSGSIELEKAIAVRSLMKQSLDLLEKNETDNNVLLSNVYSNLGMIEYGMGDCQEAQRHMRRGISILASLNDPNTHDLITQETNYARLLTETGKPADAIRILRARLDWLGPDSPQLDDMAQIQLTLGYAYIVSQNVQKAVPAIENALNIFLTLYHDNPQKLASLNQEIRYSLTQYMGTENEPPALAPVYALLHQF